MMFLHFLLLFMYCFCGFFVFLAANPMHSVLFLISTFCCSACILFLFTVDFLGIVFIVIYVGAIAILFLFVVMMLNVKIDVVKQKYSFLFLGSSFFLLQTFFFFNEILNFGDIKSFEFQNTIDRVSNVDAIGQYLYNYLLACFLIAGLILLLAMLGAILLTLNFNSNRKNQLISRQLARSVECVYSFDS